MWIQHSVATKDFPPPPPLIFPLSCEGHQWPARPRASTRKGEKKGRGGRGGRGGELLGCHKMLYMQLAGLLFLFVLRYVCVRVLHCKRCAFKDFHSSHLPFALLTLLQLSSPLSLTFFNYYIGFNNSILFRLLCLLMCRFPIANAMRFKDFHFSQDRRGGGGVGGHRFRPQSGVGEKGGAGWGRIGE